MSIASRERERQRNEKYGYEYRTEADKLSDIMISIQVKMQKATGVDIKELLHNGTFHEALTNENVKQMIKFKPMQVQLLTGKMPTPKKLGTLNLSTTMLSACFYDYAKNHDLDVNEFKTFTYLEDKFCPPEIKYIVNNVNNF